MLKILSIFKANWIYAAGTILVAMMLAIGSMQIKSHINHLEALVARYKKELKDKEKTIALREAEIDTANAKISLQNEKIASIAIESEKLRNAQPIIKKEIETRYVKIKPPDTSSKCQAKLKYYENLFRELGR